MEKMFTSLRVTFEEKKYSGVLALDHNNATINVVAYLSSVLKLSDLDEQKADEVFVQTIRMEHFLDWVFEDPMLHPGGLSGILRFAHEVCKAPEWILKFSNGIF